MRRGFGLVILLILRLLMVIHDCYQLCMGSGVASVKHSECVNLDPVRDQEVCEIYESDLGCDGLCLGLS